MVSNRIKSFNFAVKMLAVAMASLVLFAQQASCKERYPVPTIVELAKLGLTELSLDVDGVQRWFLMQAPHDVSKPAPVLIVLHGGTQSMRKMFAENAGASRGWPQLARRENALLLVPNAANAETGDTKSDDQNWNDLREDVSRQSSADDVGFILKLIEWASKNHNVDASRVYVTGASNGGMMTFRLLIEAPEKFAAGAAFIAALPETSSRIKTPTQPTPLLIANGTADRLVGYNGGKIPGGRGEMQSVAKTVKWWINANKADINSAKVLRLKDRDPEDGCTIEKTTFNAADGGAPIETYTMIGGGHNIPSAKYALPGNWLVQRLIGPVCRDVEGIELAWSFMSGFKK